MGWALFQSTPVRFYFGDILAIGNPSSCTLKSFHTYIDYNLDCSLISFQTKDDRIFQFSLILFWTNHHTISCSLTYFWTNDSLFSGVDICHFERKMGCSTGWRWSVSEKVLRDNFSTNIFKSSIATNYFPTTVLSWTTICEYSKIYRLHYYNFDQFGTISSLCCWSVLFHIVVVPHRSPAVRGNGT